MMEWVESIKPLLEAIYYVVSIILLGTLIIGVVQIRLLKKDIRDKNHRAAMEKTIEYLDWFASDFLKILDKFRKKSQEIESILVEKAPSDSKDDINDVLKTIKEYKIEADSKFILDEDELEAYKPIIYCMMMADADDLLNHLEMFAAVMTSGVADEEMAFTPLSDIYCSIVEEFYFPLCFLRKDNNKLYTNVIKLFEMWKKRINKHNIESKKEELEIELSKINDTKIKPFGV